MLMTRLHVSMVYVAVMRCTLNGATSVVSNDDYGTFFYPFQTWKVRLPSLKVGCNFH